MVAAPPRAVLCRAPTGCIAHSRRERAPCVAYVGPACTACLECRVFHAVLCGTRMWYSLLFCYLASLRRLRSVMGFFYFETTPVRPRRRSTPRGPAGAAPDRRPARAPPPGRSPGLRARFERILVPRVATVTRSPDRTARTHDAGRSAGPRRARPRRGGPGGVSPGAAEARRTSRRRARASRYTRRVRGRGVDRGRGARGASSGPGCSRRPSGRSKTGPDAPAAASGPDSPPASLPRVWVCVRRVGGRRLIPYLLSINRRAGPRNGEKPRRATARGRPGARRAGVVASPRARRRHGARRALPRPPT